MNKEENSNEVNNEDQESSEEEVEEQHSSEEEVEEQQSDDGEEVEEQKRSEEEEVEVEEQQSDDGKEAEEEVEEQQSDDGEEVEEQQSDNGEEVEEQKSIEEEEVEEQQSSEEEVKEQKSDGEEIETHNDEEKEVEEQSEEVEKQNESTNNKEENINEKIKKKKNNKKEPKPKKEIKPKFSSNCLKCNKLFKNESLYNKHTLEQVCYKNTELSYCKLCNITLTTHNEYKTHLFTLDHINQIGCNTLEKINKPNDKTIHSLDPYLNKNEVKNISSKNLGSSFTFVYETGSTQTVSLINNETHNETHNVNTTINTTINTNEHTNNNDNNNVTNNINTNEHTNNNDNSINTIIIPKPTLRQTKIINFLEKQIADNKPIQDSGNLFYKMLDNKLQIDDYKNLQKIITHLNINNDYKKTYLDTINFFISFLVKEKTNRKTIYKDKDISQLVINLTS